MNTDHIKNIVVELRELAILGLAILLFSTFIISQNKIPTSSMVNTLSVGDRLLVSRIPFYYRSPRRGEIVIFNGPDGKPWIKRVIGMPGEVIDIIAGDIYIDGVYLDESKYLVEPSISTLNPTQETIVLYPYRIPEGNYFMLGDNRLESIDCRYIGAIAEENITGKAWFKIYPFSQVGKIK